MALSLCMAGIAHAVPVLAAGIVTPGVATAFAAGAAFVFTAASQASPFASARRIVIGTAITTGDATGTAMVTGATADKLRGAGHHPAPFVAATLTPADDVADIRARAAG